MFVWYVSGELYTESLYGTRLDLETLYLYSDLKKMLGITQALLVFVSLIARFRPN